MSTLNELSATEIAAKIASGQTTAVEVVEACIQRIDEREKEVGAFEHLDRELAITQARSLDRQKVKGPLHGVPLGIKDIIDTLDMPTGWGSPIYAGRRPHWDASCVSISRGAGAVILGKTVTTEFAFFHPGKTANPHNLTHTPGGSSQGSAAAVADRMLPLAFGSQTAGSVTRPAAYCGVIGYKATTTTFDLQGVCGLAATLDTLGFFTRDLRDIALMRSVLVADEANPPSREETGLRVGFVRTPHWQEVEPCTRELLEKTASNLSDQGANLSEPNFSTSFSELADAHKTVMAFEAARARSHEFNNHRNQMSDVFVGLVETGLAIRFSEYAAAQQLGHRCRQELERVFEDYDVLLAPSAPGEAPRGLSATGDPLFNRMWTLLYVPSVTLPAGSGPNGLPLGVQIIGRHREDTPLIADAEWIQARL